MVHQVVYSSRCHSLAVSFPLLRKKRMRGEKREPFYTHAAAVNFPQYPSAHGVVVGVQHITWLPHRFAPERLAFPGRHYREEPPHQPALPYAQPQRGGHPRRLPQAGAWPIDTYVLLWAPALLQAGASQPHVGHRILHIVAFTTLCEAYLGLSPHFELLKYFSHACGSTLMKESKSLPMVSKVIVQLWKGWSGVMTSWPKA
jgi:hypothetical protein